MKARIKSNGKIVEVISRFMPRKRNAASRDWVCNLSDDTCIDESQLEYIEESIEGLDEVAEEYANKHYSEWDESWDDYNGHNVEPENDKLQLMDAFIAGAKWQEEKDARDMYMSDNRHFEKVYELGKKDMKEQMMKEAVEGTARPLDQEIWCDLDKFTEIKDGDKVRIIIVKED